jgi:hypothetical protein
MLFEEWPNSYFKASKASTKDGQAIVAQIGEIDRAICFSPAILTENYIFILSAYYGNTTCPRE